MLAISNRVRTVFFSLILVVGFLPLAALASDATSTPLKRVEHKKVCMVTNKLFAVDQIPVAFEGKTYYGCCEMCKAKLEGNPAARTAVDPISKKKVDKASAVIGANTRGEIFYFESEENLTKFKP